MTKDQKEAIKSALTASQLPVSDELLNAILQLFVTDALEVLRFHPGCALDDKIRSLKDTFELFQTTYNDLIIQLANFDCFSRKAEFVQELSATLMRPQMRLISAPLSIRICQELSNFMNGFYTHLRQLPRFH